MSFSFSIFEYLKIVVLNYICWCMFVLHSGCWCVAYKFIRIKIISKSLVVSQGFCEILNGINIDRFRFRCVIVSSNIIREREREYVNENDNDIQKKYIFHLFICLSLGHSLSPCSAAQQNYCKFFF